MRPFVVAVVVALALLAFHPQSSAAQGPATIRGTVYFCGETGTVAHAVVVLRNLTTGEQIRLVTDEHGRFARVGLLPGPYLMTAGRAEAVYDRDKASRLARLEPDDVADVRIGIRTLLTIGGTFARNPFPDEPQPVCDPPLVPTATAPFGRYVVH